MSFPVKIITAFPDFKQPGFDPEQYDTQFRQQNVLIHAAAKQLEYDRHWGPLSLKTVVKGSETYRVNNHMQTVTPANFLLLNEGTYYGSFIDADETVESFTINFTCRFVKHITLAMQNEFNKNVDCLADENHDLHFPEILNPADTNIKNILSRMLNEIELRNDKEKLAENYYELLETIILNQRNLTRNIKSVNAKKFSTKKELFTRLHIARDYIDSCYNREITLDALADVIYMNPAYLLRQFKSYFKITPRQYLIRKRMEKARDLLCSSHRSVTEICHETGYADLTSFCKLFRHFYGESPELFRSKRTNHM